MKFARNVFLAAGIYGLVSLPPLYFLEGYIATDSPPAITHPEFFYGFIGVALAWQFAFFLISRDPLRYRAFMLPGIFEKLSFAIAVVALYLQGRLAPAGLLFAAIDLTLAALFAASFHATRART